MGDELNQGEAGVGDVGNGNGTGDGVVTPDPNVAQIPIAEWEGMKAKLDVFEKMNVGGHINQQSQSQQPVGPTWEDQAKVYEQQVGALDKEIDKAVEEGKPISKLMQQRDKLNREQTSLEIMHKHVEPAFNSGILAIDALSSEVSRGKMKHYDIVKSDMDVVLNSLPANERMNPAVREKAYQLAVGQNMDKIMDAQKEEILRSAAQDPAIEPGAKNGRTGVETNPDLPNPKDVLGSEGMAALRTKGVSVDQHYQSLGYAGWEDFWEKRGKEYFGEDE